MTKKLKQDEVIDYSIKLGDRKAFELMEYEPTGSNNTSIIFSCWTTILTQLVLRGYTQDDLIQEVKFWKKVADNIASDIDKKSLDKSTKR